MFGDDGADSYKLQSSEMIFLSRKFIKSSFFIDL